jgi:methylmalonyl-CoA carboxyltransferase large subunit
MATMTVADLEAQILELSKRLAELEARNAPSRPAAAPAPVEHAAPAPMVEGITEEELLAISAAVAAFLGVRAHIRQIRLVSTNAWAQQGRVSIQASHRLG